ncbi:hypothetical protein PR202_gb06863 [Eleusine coracana subsp. coracana]|uniref:Uncharacterized protein n=1 Tax=Eleusine coracana subsp. coracana TaxID=191504 RepID=A0AAV5E894_ELECO|nr:hypothetical protein PR202_gb06863 [Eleusine coracana subsp. coracana]
MYRPFRLDDSLTARQGSITLDNLRSQQLSHPEQWQGLTPWWCRTRAPATSTRRSSSPSRAVRGRDGFRFEAVPDGLSDADRGKQDYGQSLLVVSTSQRCAAPLKDLILRLNNGTPGVPPVTCVLPTGLMSFALGVARELGIPSMAFWCGGVASLMG